MNTAQLNRKFGLIVGGVCLAIVAYQFVFKHKVLMVLGIVAFLLLLFAVIAPKILSPFRIAWDKLGHVLGTINTYLILSIVFFLMITPLGWLLKLFGKKRFPLKASQNVAAYWQFSEIDQKENFKQQF